MLRAPSVYYGRDARDAKSVEVDSGRVFIVSYLFCLELRWKVWEYCDVWWEGYCLEIDVR